MSRRGPHSLLLDSEFAVALDTLRTALSASVAFLTYSPQRGPSLGSDESLASPSTRESPSAELVALCPPDSSVSNEPFCISYTLTTGETLTLGLDFAETLEITSDPERLTRESRLLLMWAKQAMEHQVVEDRLRMAFKVHEEERERLAYELHDLVAETLVPAFQQLQTVEASTRSVPDTHRAITRSALWVREAIREVRNIMNDFHPPLLDELGLMPLVEDQASRLEEDLGVQVERRLDCVERLPREIELVLYRILSEALVNIRRHAKATAITITVEAQRRLARLVVEDNGVGFDINHALERPRVSGVMSMRRRAELAGGICLIDSEPGKGTRVEVRIPVYQEG